MVQGTDAASYDKKGPRRSTSLAVNKYKVTTLVHPLRPAKRRRTKKKWPSVEGWSWCCYTWCCYCGSSHRRGRARVDGLLQSLLATESVLAAICSHCNKLACQDYMFPTLQCRKCIRRLGPHIHEPLHRIEGWTTLSFDITKSLKPDKSKTFSLHPTVPWSWTPGLGNHPMTY